MKALANALLLGSAVADVYNPDLRSNCKANGRRLEADGEAVPAVPSFLELGGPQPPPMDDQNIFKGDTCVGDTFVAGTFSNSGSCKWFDCNADRFAYCDANYHCKCPDGMCAVAKDAAKPSELTCQIQRTTQECPPGSGVFWKMEHVEVTYKKDDDDAGGPSCEFTKTTGIDDLWDAVFWTDGADIRNITWHTVGKNSDRDFGYTADPIADSVEEPIQHGVAVSMDIKNEIAPPAGLVVENGGHTTRISMTIQALRTTDFNIDGHHWGTNHNVNVAVNMHAIGWIKQRCGKLKVTDVKRWLPCRLSEWTNWGQCHPTTAGGKTCGPGIRDRQRNILQQGTFGSECKDPLSEHQACDQGCCPVNCVLSDWSEWGKCSETCGGGKSTRTRKVVQKDECGGTQCDALTEEENCNFWVECEPQDCEWSSWGDYGDCSEQCGGGTRTRTRAITKESKEGGAQCKQEDSSEVETCNTQVCDPIDCEWSEWGPFSDCSAACNGGISTRVRTITQEAKNGGQKCDGAAAQSQECHVQACTDVWTPGDNAEIATDGVTFSGKAADAVVSSQAGVESVSVKNGNVEGSVQMGLAADTNSDFKTGQSVVLPYKGAKKDDVVTIGEQHGHALVFLNQDPTPVEDLGKIGDASTLSAKFILDEGATVRVDGIVPVPPPTDLMEEAVLEDAAVPITDAQAVPLEKTNAPNWIWLGAVAAVSMSMMVAIARRSQPAHEEQPYQPMQQ